MSFKDLIDACNAELDVAEAGSEKLIKALSAKDDTDEDIKDMAKKDAKDDDAKETDEAEDEGPDEDESEDDEDDEDGRDADARDGDLGKSMTLTGSDGEPVEVYDGTELVKSLVAAQERIARHLNVALSAATILAQKLDERDAQSAEQDTLIKSLQAQVAKLGREGRGRKAVISVHEKPSITEANPSEPSHEEIIAKANSLFKSGDFTSIDIARVETHLGRALPLPEDLKSRLGLH